MAVDIIGGLPAAQQAAAAGAQDSVVNQQEFLQILLTQLQFQDPLKPLDNQEFLAQLAQFTSLEQTRQVGEKLDSLLLIQSATQSIGLIGKTVEVSSSGGTAVGQVTTLKFNAGQPLLTVQTTDGSFLTDVSLSQISLVR
jgi:flagellar basal-body rod modification protein FlgD